LAADGAQELGRSCRMWKETSTKNCATIEHVDGPSRWYD
jgi:hypothetical protein